MAPSPKQISFFLILTLFSSIQARDSQFFNKNPSTTNPTAVPDATLPQQNQPDFVPDNENAYGLYGHGSTLNSDQSPRNYLPKNYNPVAYVSEPEDFNDNTVSFTQTQKTDSDLPPSKYLPKNYNPVAYVTEPEDFNDNTVSFTESQNTPTNYFNGQKDQDESAYKTNGGYNYYYKGGSSFNSDPERFNRNYFDSGAGADGYQSEGLKDTTLFGARENTFDNSAGTDGYQPEGLTDAKVFANRETYFDAGAGVNGYQPQGLSDTRALENGKYFYDVNREKYSTDHPYERLKGARPTYGEFP